MNCSPLLVRNNYAETSLFVFNLIFQPQFTFTTVSRWSQIYGGLTGGHALWSPHCPRTHPAPFRVTWTLPTVLSRCHPRIWGCSANTNLYCLLPSHFSPSPLAPLPSDGCLSILCRYYLKWKLVYNLKSGANHLLSPSICLGWWAHSTICRSSITELYT